MDIKQTDLPQLIFEESAGQRIMAGFSGTELNPDLKFLIDTIKVGGLILFSRNIENRTQLTQLCTDTQEYARTCGLPPLLIAVDQEGGSVARLKAPEFTEFPDASRVRDAAEAAVFAETTATELSAVGINMNMAPVLDVHKEGIDSVMARRAYSADPDKVARLGAAVIMHLQKNRVMSVAKHFPGIGRTTVDSHLERPDLETPALELTASDLIPFHAAIRHNAAGIMLSHIRYTAFDGQWPASLSPKIAHELLRRQMGYQGLILTDDLEMGAVAKYYDTATAARQILSAGVDIALVCHTLPEVETIYETFLSEGGNKQLRQLNADSTSRILAVKETYLQTDISKGT